MTATNPDLKLECFEKVKVDMENKPPLKGASSHLTTEKLNEFNLRRDISQENASPLSIAVGGSSTTHIGASSASSHKLRQ